MYSSTCPAYDRWRCVCFNIVMSLLNETVSSIHRRRWPQSEISYDIDYTIRRFYCYWRLPYSIFERVDYIVHIFYSFYFMQKFHTQIISGRIFTKWFFVLMLQSGKKLYILIYLLIPIGFVKKWPIFINTILSLNIPM